MRLQNIQKQNTKRLKLKICSGKAIGKELCITNFPASFGKDVKCMFHFDEKDLSPHHFTIEYFNSKFIIRDIHSLKGTFVNQERIEGQTFLKENDTIKAGLLVVKVALLKQNDKGKTPVKLPKIKRRNTQSYPAASKDSVDDFPLFPKGIKISRHCIDVEKTSILYPEQEKLQHSYRALRTIYKILHQSTHENDPKKFLIGFLKTLFNFISADRSAVVFYTQKSKEEIVFMDKLKRSNPFTLSQTILRDVIENGVSILCNPEENKDKYTDSDSLRHQQINSLVCVPLISSTKKLGALYLDRIQPQSPSFTQEDLELLAALGIQIGSTFEKSLVLKALAKSNAQLEETLKQLKEAQEQAIQNEKLRALGEMACGVAHDFNNALFPIVGFSELLMAKDKDLEDEKKAHYLNLINIAANDASNIVERLRSFYRHREGCDSFKVIDLNLLIEQTISLTSPKWKKALVNIEIKCHLQKKFTVLGVEAELREVLTNLIFNAVDAMEKDGTITLQTYPKESFIVLEVKDTGKGMEQETQRRCLEPFFTTKGKEGTGLGLSVMYGIIQRHQGQVHIHSKINEGTTFVITLPAHNVSCDNDKPDEK